ncbi:FAD-dependent oxidoreductase [Pelagicoccus albus]|uniref:NADH:ubiquinone reductase (non-electrogenic) n=1 Tax=Pelagicoccus albus TaxID=415222 RepID=A0A7X1B6M4_9BACT|nr:FAD-dependent oxidoreductase [Pelagicoccus albus]MBC2606610.1 FAD-dependent oxidoreductase [Pelagicoccus albus]
MTDPQETVYDIAILGGGFAGVYAARELAKRMKKAGKPISIALIAEENHMVFQPMLPEVAGATLSPRHVVNPIRNLCPDSHVYKAEATKLNFEEKSLTLSVGDFVGSSKIRFKQLALCVGAKIDLSRIPGMQEHALLMQNVGDAMRLRAHFISRFEEANMATDPEIKKRLLTFVIVGGGYSGVETAGQLIDLGRAINKHYKNVAWEDCRLVLIHSRDHVLPTLHRNLGEYTAKKLSERGVEMILERRAKAVTANKIYLDDDTVIETNTVVCTVGNAPHPLIQSLNERSEVELDRGKLKVGMDMAAPGLDWLWAAGDCASIPQEDGSTCPPTAQFAMREGIMLGKNIAARLQSKDTKPFSFKAIGELASIGHLSAVAEIKGIRFSGFIAWWMWRTIYLMKLPSLERKIRVMVDWTLELFFPRDINLLNPRYSSDVSETYLEAGDKLFHKGDPAFSFYIVKSGAIELRDEGELVTTMRANQHFGERALLNGRPYIFDAIATESTTLVSIRESVFKQIVQADASFANALEQSAKTFLTSNELDTLLRRLPDERLNAPVSSLMTKDPVFVRNTDSISDVVKLLRERPKSYLPVLDADEKPIGVIRKEAFLLHLQTTSLERSDSVQTLDLLHLPHVTEDEDIRHAMTLMARSSATKALVTTSEGKLSGVIALVDVISMD